MATLEELKAIAQDIVAYSKNRAGMLAPEEYFALDGLVEFYLTPQPIEPPKEEPPA